MIPKQKILPAIFLVFAASSGAFVGFQWGRGAVDPQASIQSVFTPYQDGIASYLDFLDKAHQSVRIAGYSFTDDRIVEKLLALKKRGVDVKVLLDYFRVIHVGIHPPSMNDLPHFQAYLR